MVVCVCVGGLMFLFRFQMCSIWKKGDFLVLVKGTHMVAYGYYNLFNVCTQAEAVKPRLQH